MRKSACLIALAVGVCLMAPVAWGQEGVDDQPALTVTDGLTQADITAGMAKDSSSWLDHLRRLGLMVFTTPFNTFDGLGDGPFDPSEVPPMALGHRPTLQGNGQVLRVNGLDSQSCNECHGIVSHAARPPILGIAGVGGMVQNAIIMPSLIDVADSFDDRVQYLPGHDPDLAMKWDGVADYNGRFANPPFLFGGGGVELLGKEMTLDLQKRLAVARHSPAGTVIELTTHGVSFGYVETLNDQGDVRLQVEGIGPEDATGVAPEAVLVVRPFGRKGENFSMRDFDRGAMQFHFGMQPVEVVGEGVDDDGDGVVDEVTVAEMTVLHLFDVTNPVPFIDKWNPDTAAGFKTFQAVGCSQCHRPVLETRSRFLPLAYPEVAANPLENVYFKVDLKEVGFEVTPAGGVYVPLFADLKRHKMGPRLAESFERGEIADDEFTTARLWGIADTAPYLHDGRATTLFQAIEFHGGEAQGARDAFLALPRLDQVRLLAFLRSLRTPIDPNKDIASGP